MELIKQTGPHCLPCALAMFLGKTFEEMIKELGHDGTEVAWPEAVGFHKYRGYHPQEIIDYFYSMGYSMTIIEAMPAIGTKGSMLQDLWYLTTKQAEDRMQKYFDQYCGIILSDTHAVAWNTYNRRVYDPRGHIYPIERFPCVKEFWIPLPISDTAKIINNLPTMGCTV